MRDFPDDAFSRLQLRLNPTDHHQQHNSARMNLRDASQAGGGEDYFYSRVLADTQGRQESSADNEYNNYFYGGPRSGKNWIIFVIACFDLGCSSLAIFLDGRTIIHILVNGGGHLLISSVTCFLLLAFFWFIAAWKLLESSYRRKQVSERYHSAKFWQCMNIVMSIFLVLSFVLSSFCIYGSICNEIGQDYHNTMFQVCFPIAVTLMSVQRVISLLIVNKYIEKLKNDLLVDSLPLSVL